MTRYVYRDGAWRDPATGVPMFIPDRREVCAPAVQSDIEAYRSPIDGKPITSQSHRRYDLESNGCVPAEPRKKHKGYSNARFARKYGLKLSEEAMAKTETERA